MVFVLSIVKSEGGRKNEGKYHLSTYKGRYAVFYDQRYAPPDLETVEKLNSSKSSDDFSSNAFFVTQFDALLDNVKEDHSPTNGKDVMEVLMAEVSARVAARENVTIVNRGCNGVLFVEKILRSLQKSIEASAENAMQIVADEIAKEKQMQRLLQLENESDLQAIREVVKSVNDAEITAKGNVSIKFSAKLAKSLQQLRRKHEFLLTSGRKPQERFTLLTATHHDELIPPYTKGSCLTPESFAVNPPLRYMAPISASRNGKNSSGRNSYFTGRLQRRSTRVIMAALTDDADETPVSVLKGNGWGDEFSYYVFDGESSVMALPGIPKFEDLIKGFTVDFWFKSEVNAASEKRVIVNIMDGQRADIGQLFQISLKRYEDMNEAICIYVRDSTNRVLECTMPLKTAFPAAEDSFHHFLLNVQSLEEGNLDCVFDGDSTTLQIVQQEYPIFFNPWPHRLFVGGYLDEQNNPVHVFQGTIFHLRFGQGIGGSYKPIVSWPLLENDKLKEVTRTIPPEQHQTLIGLEKKMGSPPRAAPSLDGNLVVNLGSLGVLGELMYNWRLEVRFKTTVNSRAMSLIGVTDRQCRMQEFGIVLNAEPVFGKERFRFHEFNITLYLVDAFGAACSALLRGSELQNLMDGEWHTIVWKCIDSEANSYRVKVDGVAQELLYLARESPRRFLPFVDWVCLGGHNVRSWKVKRPFFGEIGRLFVSVRGIPLTTLNMDEGPGAYVMQDISRHHHHGLLINSKTHAIRRHDIFWFPQKESKDVEGTDAQGQGEIVIHKNNVVSLAAVIFTCQFTASGVAQEAVIDLLNDTIVEPEVVENHICDNRPEWKTWRAIPESSYRRVDSIVKLEETINSVLAREKPLGHFMFVMRIGDSHVTLLNLHGPVLPPDATYNRGMLKWHYAYSVSGTKGRRELLLHQMLEGVESILLRDTFTPFTAVKLGPLNTNGKSIVTEEVIRTMQNSGKPWYLCAVLHNHLLNAQFGSSLHIFHHIHDNFTIDEAASIALFNKHMYDSTKEKASLMIQRNWKARKARQVAVQLDSERQIRERKVEEIRTLRMNPIVMAKERLSALIITLHEVQCEVIPPISDDILSLSEALENNGYEVTRLFNPNRAVLLKTLTEIDEEATNFIYISAYGGSIRVRQPFLLPVHSLYESIAEGSQRASIENEWGSTFRLIQENFRAELPPPRKSGKGGKRKAKAATQSKKAVQEEEMAARQREEMFRIAVLETEEEETTQRGAMVEEYNMEVLMIVRELDLAVMAASKYEQTYKNPPASNSFILPCEARMVEPYASAVYSVDEILEAVLQRHMPPMGLQRIVAMDLEPITSMSCGLACVASSTGYTLRIPYQPQQRRILTDILQEAFEGRMPCVPAHSKYAVLHGGIETPDDQRDWRSFATYIVSRVQSICVADTFAKLRRELDREVPFTAELIPVRNIKLDADTKQRRDRETKQVTLKIRYAVGSSQVQSDMFSLFRNIPHLGGVIQEITFKNTVNVIFTKNNKNIDGLITQSIINEVEKCRPHGCSIGIEVNATACGVRIMFNSKDSGDKLLITQWLNSIVVRSLTWQLPIKPLLGYGTLEVGLVEYIYELKSTCTLESYTKLSMYHHEHPCPMHHVRFLGCEANPL